MIASWDYENFDNTSTKVIAAHLMLEFVLYIMFKLRNFFIKRKKLNIIYLEFKFNILKYDNLRLF